MLECRELRSLSRSLMTPEREAVDDNFLRKVLEEGGERGGGLVLGPGVLTKRLVVPAELFVVLNEVGNTSVSKFEHDAPRYTYAPPRQRDKTTRHSLAHGAP
mmetsp:Transcript_6713/g.20899  ORF Transcript_6713/g.20899 Transcript_6713/m.20899 type:complete len:102 (-) Transcript_6713:110-415(-)